MKELMDLETENRLAAVLLKEAAELRREAEKDGVRAYLQKPDVRGRPNSQFLTATIRGVQQANRAVEVNEMWRVRQKERELDDRVRERSRHRNSSSRSRGCSSSGSISKNQVVNGCNINGCSSSKRNCMSSEDGGLKDEEIEEFLRSRVKRGRGAIGSRMDETGPYLLHPESTELPSTRPDARENRVVLGPMKPASPTSSDESSDEEELDTDRWKNAKKVRSRSSSDKDSKKRRRTDRSRDKKKKRKEKRSEH